MIKDLLNKIKGFKYQITVKVSLKKHKENGGIEVVLVHFSSTTKTVINLEYKLNKSFQETLQRIDNWINEGSGIVTESVDTECVNISIYSLLSWSRYIELPNKLKIQWKVWLALKKQQYMFSLVS